MGVLHPRVDTAPETSMAALWRELTGNAEESNKANPPGTWSVGSAGFVISSSCWTCLPPASQFGHALSGWPTRLGNIFQQVPSMQAPSKQEQPGSVRGQEISGYKA